MKRFFVAFVLIFVTSCVLTLSVAAAGGSCGTSATWSFDADTGTLTVSGSGEVTSSPWSSYAADVKSIVIGNNITRIAGTLFYGCNGVEEITLPFIGEKEGATGYTSVLGYIFGYTATDWDMGYPTLGSLGYGVQYVEYSVQSWLGGGHVHEDDIYRYWTYKIPQTLKKVTLTKGTARGFANSKVSTVVLDKNVKNISSNAFAASSSVVNISILGTISSIPANAFKESGYYKNAANWENNVLYIDGHLIEYKDKTSTEYTVKDGTRAIAQNAFLNRTNLVKLTLPAGINSMSLNVFSGCTSIKEITVPFGGTFVPKSTEKLTVLGGQIFNNTFKDYSSLKEVILADGITSIGSNAFQNCSSLSLIYIPASVTAFGDNIFNSAVTICGDKGSVAEMYAEENNIPFVTCVHSFGDWVTDGENTYRECTKCGEIEDAYVQGECGEDIIWSLNKMTGKLSLNGFGDMYDYTDSVSPWVLLTSTIKTIVIEDGISSIGVGAFKNCSLVESITIPESVETIHDGSIDDCLNATVYGFIGGYAEDYSVRHGFAFSPIDIADRSGTCGDAIWSYYEDTERLMISGTGGVIADASWEDFASDVKSVWVADSITSIADNAFRKFTSLEEIKLPFIGKQADAESYESVFGYVFGYECLLGWMYDNEEIEAQSPLSTYQYTVENYINGELDLDYSDYYCYFIPKTLKKVIFTGTKLPERAFYNCSMLDSIMAINVETVGNEALGKDATVYCYTNTPIYKYVVNKNIPFVAYCSSEMGHTFSEKVTESTCNAQGYTTYTCQECGYSYKGNYVATKQHSYTSVITEPTCTADGYTTHTCINCGDSYRDGTVKSTGHSYGEWTKNEGYNTSYHKCSICSATESRVSSGSIGSNAKWFIDYNKGILYISGEGVTDSFTTTSYPGFHTYRQYFNQAIIEEGITGLGAYTFSKNSYIQSISLPSTYSVMNENVIFDCTNLKKVVISDLKQWLGFDFATSTCNPLNCGGAALYIGDEILEELVIPDEFSGVKKYAFAGCSSIKSVVMNDNVLTMDVGSFYKCTSLTDIKFSANMTTIYDSGFYGCTSLKEVVIPENITRINASAFRACTSLSKATVMLSTTTFGSYVFKGCTNLTIYGHSGSKAEAYANKNSIAFAVINDEAECSHSFSGWVTVDATCTADGKKTRTCSACGETETEIIPSTGHSFGDWSNILDPECDRAGIKSRSCSACGETETEAIPSTGHSYEKVVTAPTCTTDGYTTYTCISCGASYTDDVVASTGHSFGDWIVDLVPTVETEGSQHRECSACGETETESIPKFESSDYDAIFTLSSANAKPGETVKLTLSLKTEVAINSIAISSFTYDTDVLEFVGFGDYERIEEMPVLTAMFDDDAGFILIGFTEDIIFDGDICTLEFKVRDGVEDTVAEISAKPTVKLGSKLINSKLDNAEVNVYTYLKGDIDGDNDVDIDDAVLLFASSMLPEHFIVDYPGEMDFNKDGNVDIYDAIVLFNYSMLPDIYPID